MDTNNPRAGGRLWLPLLTGPSVRASSLGEAGYDLKLHYRCVCVCIYVYLYNFALVVWAIARFIDVSVSHPRPDHEARGFHFADEGGHPPCFVQQGDRKTFLC